MTREIYDKIETCEERDKKVWEAWLSTENGARLKRIREYVENKWRARPDIRFFTSHNHQHSQKVEENLHLLIPGYTFGLLCEEERFLLLTAAWLHDLGMLKGLLLRDVALNDDEIRDQHETRSIEYIRDHYDELDLSLGEVASLSFIIKYHRSHTILTDCPEEDIIQHSVIRLRLLAGYLRLADAIHIDESRIDAYLYRVYKSDMPIESKLQWVISRMVPGIFPDPQTHCIRISFHVPEGWGNDGKDISPLRSIFEHGLQRELDMIKDTLVLGGITTYLDVRIEEKQVSVFSSEDVTELAKVIDNIQIMQYPNASRLIGALLESISQYCEGVEEDPDATYQQVKQYVEYKLSADLQMRHSHLGAKSILNQFKNKIENVEDSSAEQKINCIYEIQDMANSLAEDRVSVLKKIGEVALEGELFSPDDSILIFGYSSTIREILSKLPGKKQKIIYVAECRNKTIYTKFSNKMTYNDGVLLAEEISRLGYTTIYFISDASVAHYLTKGEIKKVLFGANGIKRDRGDLHSVGHLMIADLASVYNVPVYVAADTLKVETAGFSNKIDIDAERPNFWSTEDITHRNRMSKASINERRPRLDIVPFEKITLFITEKGIAKSKEELFRLCDNKKDA